MARVLNFIEIDREEAEFGSSATFSRFFKATVDTLDGAIPALRRARPDLQRYQPHPDQRAWVTTFSPSLIPGTLTYDIEVRYSSEAEDVENPLLRPADIEWTTRTVRERTWTDGDGDTIKTTAGSIIQGIEVDRRYWGFTATKNVSTVPAWVADYSDAINLDAVRVQGIVFPPGTLQIADIKITGPHEETGVEFMRLAISALHNPRTWKRRWPNVDYYELIPSRVPGKPPARVRITDSTGRPVETPQWLDHNGRRPRITLPDGREFIKEPLDPGDLVFVEAWTSTRRPFRVLPLN